jgi:hypothetical protein
MGTRISSLPLCLAIANLTLVVMSGCGQDDRAELIPLSHGAQFITGAMHLSAPIIGAEGLPLVRGTVDGVDLILLLDTGTVASMVSSTLLGVEDDSEIMGSNLVLYIF